MIRREPQATENQVPLPPGRKGGGASHQRGTLPRPQGGCMVFAAKGGIRDGARRRRTSPVERYFIPPEGGSPQPACKAKPITGRTLGAQGRKARRRHQPSRRSRVNLREYWKAPPRSRSRSRPRHRRLNPQAQRACPYKKPAPKSRFLFYPRISSSSATPFLPK